MLRYWHSYLAPFEIWSGIQMVQPFEYQTLKSKMNLVFRCPVFRWLLYVALWIPALAELYLFDSSSHRTSVSVQRIFQRRQLKFWGRQNNARSSALFCSAEGEHCRRWGRGWRSYGERWNPDNARWRAHGSGTASSVVTAAAIWQRWFVWIKTIFLVFSKTVYTVRI